MHAHDAKSVADLLTRHGLRRTRQRVALYQALAASKAHPTADELYRAVADDLDGISVATVYNSLEAFCKAGLINKLPPAPTTDRVFDDEGEADADTAASEVPSSGRAARYDASTHPHMHIRCLRTGRVRDVPDDLGEQLLAHLPQDVLRRLEDELGFDVRQVQVELVGESRSR